MRGPFSPNASLLGEALYFTSLFLISITIFCFFQGLFRFSTWFLRQQFWVVTSTSISTFRTGCSFGKKRSAETKRYSKSGTWDVDSQIISNLRWVIHLESCLLSFLCPSKNRSTGERMTQVGSSHFDEKISLLQDNNKKILL